MICCSFVALYKTKCNALDAVLDVPVALVALVALFSNTSYEKKKKEVDRKYTNKSQAKISATSATSATASTETVINRCTLCFVSATEVPQVKAGTP